MKSKKPVRPVPRARRRSPTVVEERHFTVVLEDLSAKFAVFGEALQGLREEMSGIRDELRTEMHAIRDDLRGEMREMRSAMGEIRSDMGEMRTDIALLKTAVLDLSKRIP